VYTEPRGIPSRAFEWFKTSYRRVYPSSTGKLVRRASSTRWRGDNTLHSLPNVYPVAMVLRLETLLHTPPHQPTVHAVPNIGTAIFGKRIRIRGSSSKLPDSAVPPKCCAMSIILQPHESGIPKRESGIGTKFVQCVQRPCVNE
jgi:hypothetical protein